MNVEIIPSILVSSAEELSARLRAIGKNAPVVQLDVLDNSLIPYQNFYDPEFINGLSPTVSFEVHLMVKDVADAIPKWNYDWVKKLIFHLEAGADAADACRQIRALGKLAGIAISPGTPAAAVLPLLNEADLILVMTVKPGRNSAPFLPPMLDKVSTLRRRASEMDIEVDGGVSSKTLKNCRDAGANLFVVGSFLENDKFVERYQQLTRVLQIL